MLTLVTLCGEFFAIGLFSVGGGMATVPFLLSLSQRRGWFSTEDLANIIAISEATPGPIGVNMATYVGYLTSGFPGAALATLALALPAFLIILLLANVLQKHREHRIAKSLFYGLRPASAGLIAAVFLSLAGATFFALGTTLIVNWKALALFAALSLILALPQTRKLPIPLLLLFAALAGLLLQL